MTQNFNIRTVDEIFQELLLEKQNLTSLSGLSTNGITDQVSLISALSIGNVPDWILWMFNMAVSTHLTDVATQTAIDDIDNAILNSIVPTERWYISKALAFQYGDSIIIDPVTYEVTYETINEANKVVGSCTSKSLANTLYLKVRGSNTDLLSTDEKTALTGYMNQIKVPGTQIVIENFEGDQFTLNLNIIYDASYSLDTIKSDVETAISDYLNNINYDSRFISLDLVEAIQDVEGVRLPQFNESSVIDAAGNTTSFLHEYETYSGYGTINPATPLTSTITYTIR